MGNESIQAIIEQHATQEGVTETGIPGLQLYRIHQPLKRTPAIYTPRICINVRGSKRVFSNAGVHIYDSRHFICCTMPVPVEADVPVATPEDPVLGVSLELNSAPFRDLIQVISATQGLEISGTESLGPEGLAVGLVSDALEEAMCRLLELTGDPTALRALSHGRLAEVYYVLLIGPLGPVIRRRFGDHLKIAETVCYLQDNISEPLTIDQLAKWSGMSRATFHRRFKDATGLAPIQFIKEFRLNTAAMHLAAGMRTGDVADAVGYNSQSQFSREFKRLFGESPRDWISPSS